MELSTVLTANFWPAFDVSTFELAFKGLLIGILASAPMGPVGILCINRTIQKGRIYGIATGAGAALSDIFYALVTGLGMSFMMDFINNQRNLFILKLVGSVLLLVFGIYMFRADPRKGYRHRHKSKKRGTLLHNFFTAFLLTLGNPLIIFLFTASFALLTFVVPEHFFEQCVGYTSIVAGAMLWWIGLTYVIDKMRNRFNLHGILRMNRTIGTIVMLISVAYAAMTLFHLSLY